MSEGVAGVRADEDRLAARLSSEADLVGAALGRLMVHDGTSQLGRWSIGGELGRALAGRSEEIDAWVGGLVSDEGLARELWESGGAQVRTALVGNRWMGRELVEEWERGSGVSVGGGAAWARDVLTESRSALGDERTRWEATRLVRALYASRGVTQSAAEEMLSLLEAAARRGAMPRSQILSGISMMLSYVLEGAAWPHVSSVTTCLNRLWTTSGRNDNSAMVILDALSGTRQLDTRRLGELVGSLDWRFAGPWAMREIIVADIERGGEEILEASDLWPALLYTRVSDEGFTHLVERAGRGELEWHTLIGLTTNETRTREVLATHGEQGLPWGFYTEGPVGDAALTWRVVRAGGLEGEVLGLGVGAGGRQDFSWLHPSFITDMDEAAQGRVVESLRKYGGPHGLGNDTARIVRALANHVRGAAWVMLWAGNPTAHTVLADEMATTFGTQLEVARALVNPTTSLRELTDVVARLGELERGGE